MQKQKRGRPKKEATTKKKLNIFDFILSFRDKGKRKPFFEWLMGK